MMVLSLSFTIDILMIFWVQLQCVEKILKYLLILLTISTHPFTVSEVGVNFLDIKLCIKADEISTSVYYRVSESRLP